MSRSERDTEDWDFVPARRIELIAEAFNVTNRRNWTGYDGVMRNATFGKPTASAGPREVQLGVRVAF